MSDTNVTKAPEVAMRRVKYEKRTYISGTDNRGARWKKESGEGFFHCWGTGNIPTAIVELDDGRVRCVFPENIQFIDR